MNVANAVIKNHDQSTTARYDMVTLDYEGRFVRRKKLTTDNGEVFLVELPEMISVSAGDGFVLDDGRVIMINAMPELLMKISHMQLVSIAWHIGNRHTPCQIEEDHLLIQSDHVLEKMVLQLGAEVEYVTEPFMPEGGAYGHGRTHGHKHHHD